MNLPIKGFRVATNQNDVLHRLFKEGEYTLGEVSQVLLHQWIFRWLQILKGYFFLF